MSGLNREYKKEEAVVLAKEAKYQVLQPPVFESVAAAKVAAYKSAYERYKSARAKDGLPVVDMRDTIDRDLKDYFAFQDESRVEEARILKDETTFAAYLNSLLTITDQKSLSAAFEELVMDIKNPDPLDRVVEYGRRFMAVKKRVNNSLLKQLKTDALVEAYVSGVRPKVVQRELKEELQWRTLTLPEVISLTEEKVRVNEDQFLSQKAREGGGEAGASSPQRKKETRTPVKVENPPAVATVPAVQTQPARRYDTRSQYTTYTPNYSNNHNHHKPRDTKPKDSNNLEIVTGPAPLKAFVTEQKILTEAIADSGSVVSFITSKLADELRKSVPRLISVARTNTQLRMANGSTDKSAETVTTEVTICLPRGVAEEVITKWTFYVLPDAERARIILGTDIFGELGLVQDGYLVLPWSRGVDSADVELNAEGEELDACAVETVRASDEAVVQARRKAEVEKISIPCDELKDDVLALCGEFSEVFDSELPKEGVLFSRDFPIELTEDRVIVEPSPTLREPQLSRILEEVEKQERAGILEPTESNYRQHVFGVKKKDGKTVRLVQNSAPLNKITKLHNYPMPKIQDVLSIGRERRYHGKCDCRKGFHQWRVEPSSRKYTSFEIRGVRADGSIVVKRLQYAKAPMGYVNLPMYYQEEMDKLFRELKDLNVVRVYIDDIYFVASTREEFLSTLRHILVICKDHRLRLSAEKCTFGATELEVLGQIVSAGGRRIADTRVQAMRNLAAYEPKNLAELRVLVGNFVYLHDFIPNFHLKVAPLNRLLRKGVRFEWGEAHRQAVKAVMADICSDITLAYGDEEGDLVLKTDASQLGLGAVLVVRSEGVDRPVCYISKTFSPAQRKWSTYQQELFAIVYSMTHPSVHHLLSWRVFRVETDHRNLVYLESAGEKSAMIERWKLLMLPYRFSVKHVPGETNAVPDMLSRLNHPESKECAAVEVALSGLPSREDILTAVKSAQEKEVNALESNVKLQKDATNLFREISTGRVYVPAGDRALVDRVISYAHGSPFSGHFGYKRTVDAVLEAGLTWDGLVDDVQTYIRTCGICQKTRLRQHIAKQVNATVADQPFYLVSVDTLGPFEGTKFKYLVVLIDSFSRWTELVPTLGCDAKAAADAMYESVFLRQGLPAKLKSDNGPQYANRLVTTLLEHLNIVHHDILPYTPQMNGQVERENREILRHLRCLVCDFVERKEWHQLIPYTQFVLNHTIHGVTGVTPYAMLFGDHVRARRFLPNMLLDTIADDAASVEGGAEYVKLLGERIKIVQDTARMRQHMVIEKEKKKEERREDDVSIGELVLVTPVKKPGKTQSKLEGPYKVVARPSAAVYRLQSLVNPEVLLETHYLRLRKFQLKEEMTPEAQEKLARQLAQADDGEFTVEAVRSHTGSNKKNVRFLIKWTGYPEEENTEEPWSHVFKDNTLNECVRNYVMCHPELHGLLA